MGIARLALAGLGVLALVALIVVGVLSLIGALGSDPAGPRSAASPVPTAAASSTGPERVPTVLIECLRENCPTVFLKITGGDVILDREMAKGEQVQSFDPKVDVVLADSAAVRVLVNGDVREPGEAGERQEFTVSRED
ncbi:hypothetical protein GCM10010517_08600 [Streptosporangium fragile]|uniref:DUF4115 domain-containing protein n=1 Tax=Streptosporangium fragile TaxID=46186 RepID=A0ABN3VR36_9ACTN